MRVAGLSKHYGDQQALADVSFDVHGNEILGLIGSERSQQDDPARSHRRAPSCPQRAVLWRDSALPFDRSGSPDAPNELIGAAKKLRPAAAEIS